MARCEATVAGTRALIAASSERMRASEARIARPGRWSDPAFPPAQREALGAGNGEPLAPPGRGGKVPDRR
jgi:hypothetical protein